MDTIIKVVQNDILYDLDFTLQDSKGLPIDITGATLILEVQNTNKTTLKFTGDMVVVDGQAGTCKYTVQATNFDAPGKYYGRIKVTFGSGETLSFVDVVINVVPALPK